jgi:uncharacterized protein (TIGR02246 family)
MPDEQTRAAAEIRCLIERWAEAVRRKDIDGVLADHARDVLMFDVPPPVAVAGIDAYRETWPPFFDWQKRGQGTFELVSLDVTAGDTVAFATAVLRCGTTAELAQNPEARLRLTVGLRKENGRWVIAHEHHSFPAEPSG